MDAPVTFGEWLRRSRDERRLTREEFARCVGCSVSTLRKIEGGERRPSDQIAGLIADCLDILPAERRVFVRVARGELTVGRLPQLSGSTAGVGRASASSSRTNLPELPTPLVGRQRELNDLSRLLGNPDCRLLTLVGPGGIGKTRLAIAVASQLRADFSDGAYFVPLDSVSSADRILPLIADALDFAFEHESRLAPKTQLFNYLREKQALLVMDNLEHLLTGPGIEVLAELSSKAPRVKLLATSRVPLNLQGEWIFEVQGLPVPESDRAEERNLQNTSVELFLQRARRAHAGFSPTRPDYLAIVRICQLVEGMPLAIELAAAWVRTLSCDEIAREIERGLDVLSASTRDLPARHRSIRAVFDQSWRLLPEDERSVLLYLSVFRGGFDRPAAEQVAGASLTDLFALVMKSLIRRTGDERYDLHELVRQYVAGHLSEQPEEEAAVQARHGRYYLSLFGQADRRIRSSGQPEALAQLTAEMDNFRMAWGWAIAHREFALIEGALRTFSVFYDARGWIQTGFDQLEGALDILETAHGQAPSDRTIQVALAHLLAARGLLAVRLGRHGEAQAMLERSLELIHPWNEPRVLVESLAFLGTAMETTGKYERAGELYAQALEVARRIGDRWFIALGLMLLAQLASFAQTTRPEETYARLQAVVVEWRLVGDPRFTTLALSLLGLSASNLGRYEEARAALEECAALSASIGDRWGVGLAYRGLGLVAEKQGLHAEAMDILRKGLEISTELGARQEVARSLADLGRNAFALGNDQEAERLWHEALQLAMETGGPSGALEALMGLARLQAKRGDTERALELLLMVLDHPAAVPGTKNRAGELRDQLASRLTDQRVQAAMQRARAKPFEDAVRGLLKG